MVLCDLGNSVFVWLGVRPGTFFFILIKCHSTQALTVAEWR